MESVGLQETIYLVSGHKYPIPNYNCQASPSLAAVIGATRSAVSIPMARYLGLYKIPQVSYASSAIKLSDRTQFPSFFRTIASDQAYFMSLSMVLTHFGWKWLGLVAQDDEYGQQGGNLISAELSKVKVCLEFSVTFPTYPSNVQISNTMRVLKGSTAKVIMVFITSGIFCLMLQTFSEHYVAGRLWVSQFTEQSDHTITTPNTLQILQKTFSFMDHNMIEELSAFFNLSQPTRTQEETFLRRFWNSNFKCEWATSWALLRKLKKIQFCAGASQKSTNIPFLTLSHVGMFFNTYEAVYSVAHALHTMKLDDDPLRTVSPAEVQRSHQPWQLLPYFRKVHFTTSHGKEILFDANGDIPAKYEVLYGKELPEHSFQLVSIGHVYVNTLSKTRIVINKSALGWLGGLMQLPRSVCSESCPPGSSQVPRQGWPHCCFECSPCPAGHFADRTDMEQCTLCPEGHYPDKKREHCLPKEEAFLAFNEPLGLVLACVALSLSALSVLVLVVFVWHRDTPIVKANNRTLSYTLLVSLTFCFLCSLLFLGRPSPATCLLRQVTFALGFTVAVSSVLAKTLTVVMAFQMTRPASRARRWLGPQNTHSIVLLCSLIQVTLCGIWLGTSPPFPAEDPWAMPSHIFLQCDKGSITAFYCVLGYLGFLVLGTFAVAFLARNLPDAFNEAKFLTFSMLVSCSVWVAFLPSYHSIQGKALVAVEVFSIVASSAGLLGCIFAPKCYVILLHPERNTIQALKRKTEKSLPEGLHDT
ncbi:vomeronasal type-2 receptor 26-like [Nycticebus coucang]|uniref:vomeronasal type-2 receptor 26-like n=1 Tax=Nycticebus coucang TaxID=9470 RepID=UPI00234E0A79|nr:vomeronasal type-2 receptor 26-like [Nycticebus coucang]XP_053460756.1 vomeronasal type-2 receptor 26-like [Nycticebus coucang]XP_053460757.1 vomeronasal type-2 receptor 26-like [Nycticebus coucang]XP_053460758.1 vomeronasal type-2 receptor 26-like [Nycticebus coucang]